MTCLVVSRHRLAEGGHLSPAPAAAPVAEHEEQRDGCQRCEGRDAAHDAADDGAQVG